MPAGTGGIGFDDIRYSAALDAVLVPAGHTGKIDLLEPGGSSVTVVGGFSQEQQYAGGHRVGTTSADAGGEVIVATDRTVPLVAVVDAKARAITASTRLDAQPDLVRFVVPTREIWVTEPDRERIEVFTLAPEARATPVHDAFISAPGGPESLTIDGTRRRAYSHFGSTTVAIDLATRTVVARWSTGCASPSGVALDEAEGLLFVGCSDGQVAVLGLASGAVLARQQVGGSVDHIAFSASRRHLYVPDTKRAEMTTFAVLPNGQLEELDRIATMPGTECVTTDDQGHVYLCDPAHGTILVVTDDSASLLR
jgi:6-phosphogluconolactonase (cycloisomerase 2 family)